MTIVVKCECGTVLKVPEEHAGKRGKCPGCGAILTIPAAEPQAPPPTPQEEVAAAQPETPTPAAPEKSQPAAPTEEAPAPPAPEDKATRTPPTAPPTDPDTALRRLRELEEQIPYTDEDELGSAKELALGLAAVPGLIADAAKDMITRLGKRLDDHAATVGEDDAHLKILREMHAIATTIVESK